MADRLHSRTHRSGDRVDRLRSAMVDELWRLGAVRTGQLTDAFGVVPRHVFAPGAPLEAVYAAERPVTARWCGQGLSLTSMPAASALAVLLELAKVEAGMRVLVVGAGAAYVGALVAELVGEDGAVTVAVDGQVEVDRAQQSLAAAEFFEVTVVPADAAGGSTDPQAYDRVIVTSESWDVAPGWRDQLADGGRLVVPLRLPGLVLVLALEADGGRLVSREHQVRTGPVTTSDVDTRAGARFELLHGEVGLWVEGPRLVAVDELAAALMRHRLERWSGLDVDSALLGELDLWLLARLPGACVLAAEDVAIEAGLVARSARTGTPTAVTGHSLAYRVVRPAGRRRPDRFEVGVYAHDPDATMLADAYLDLIRQWDREHRNGPGPHIAVFPRRTPDGDLPAGLVIDRRYSRIVISWPPPSPASHGWEASTRMPQTTRTSTGADPAAAIRDALTDQLRSTGMISSPVVEQAFRRVPRHVFVPEGTPLEAAYDAGESVAVKRDHDGVIVSSISAPFIQARMIEQAGLGPGMSVLEIGSGGCNAALLAEVVGPGGRVVSVDIDPVVVGQARVALDAAGYGSRVEVVQADAEHGLAALGGGPVDAVVVTAGAWDLAPAWLAQLSGTGVIVVPLRMNGVTRSIAFRWEGDHLVSTSAEVCGFVPMQGVGARDERVFLLPDPRGGNVKLRFDSAVPQDIGQLDGVLAAARTEVWSGVTIEHGESFADLHLWFASFLPGFCKLATDEDTALTAQRHRWFPFAVVRGDSFAYLAVRPASQGGAVAEFGATAYGTHGHAAATAMVEQIQAWDRLARRGPGATFAYWPTGTRPPQVSGCTAVLPKTHGMVAITWPTTG